MKGIFRAVALVPAVAFFLTFGQAFADAPFHIGICTETVSQNEDDLRAAEQFMKKYNQTGQI